MHISSYMYVCEDDTGWPTAFVQVGTIFIDFSPEMWTFFFFIQSDCGETAGVFWHSWAHQGNWAWWLKQVFTPQDRNAFLIGVLGGPAASDLISWVIFNDSIFFYHIIFITVEYILSGGAVRPKVLPGSQFCPIAVCYSACLITIEKSW